MRKFAQTNAEFLVVLLAMLLIAYILVLAQNGQRINLTQSISSVNNIKGAYSLSSVINYVYLAGEGCSYTFMFYLPQDSSATLYAGQVEVRSALGVSSAPLVTRNIIHANITRGQHTVRNVKGVITID